MKTDYKGITIPDYIVVMKWIEKQGKCVTDLHKELDITYKHLHDLKHTFIILGWVKIQKEERRHNILLTEKGQEIVNIATTMLKTMGFGEEKIKEYLEKGKLKKKEKVNVNELSKEVENYNSENNNSENQDSENQDSENQDSENQDSENQEYKNLDLEVQDFNGDNNA